MSKSNMTTYDNFYEDQIKVSKNFDKKIGKKIYHVMNNYVKPTTEIMNLINTFKTVNDVKKILPKYNRVDQLIIFKTLFVNSFMNGNNEILADKIMDSKLWYNWELENREYLLYDPRLKIISKISQKMTIIRLLFIHMKSKKWRERKFKVWYWKVRYRSKWKHIKLNYEWDYPVFLPIDFNKAELKLEQSIKNGT